MLAFLKLLLMIKLLGLIFRLVGDVDADLGEEVFVNAREYDRRVRLAASQLAELIYCKLSQRICDSADGKCDEQLIGVQARIVVSEMLDLQVLDRLNDAGRDEQQLLVNAGKLFERVHKAGR